MKSKVSIKDLLDMGAYIKDMPVEKLKASLIAMVSKHPTTALKIVFERKAINTYTIPVPNRFIQGQVTNLEVVLTPVQFDQIKKEWYLGAAPYRNKIGAIKILRNITGLGLADSKYVIEWFDGQGHFN
jgi:hypothetical protein